MNKIYLIVFFLITTVLPAPAQNAGGGPATAFIATAAKAMGLQDLSRMGSYSYSGTEVRYEFGQARQAGGPWPKTGECTFHRMIDFDAEGLVQTGTCNPKRRPAPRVEMATANLDEDIERIPFRERYGEQGNQYEVWVSPPAFLKGAMTNGATLGSARASGKQYTTLSFVYSNNPDKYKVTGYFNSANLMERATVVIDDPLLGDTNFEAIYSDYKDMGHGLIFASTIAESEAGFPVRQATVTGFVRNPIANPQIPVLEPVRHFDRGIGVPYYHGAFLGKLPPATVDEVLYSENVYYLRFRAGDDIEAESAHPDYHSIVVEFKDYLVVIEAPLDERHALAAIHEIRMVFGEKPIRYVIETHSHLDTSGGLRTYAAQGATILTASENKVWLEKTLARPHTIVPDKLSQSKRRPVVEAVGEKRVLTDGEHTIELYHVPNQSCDGMLMAFFPKEKIVVEADLYVIQDPDLVVNENGEPLPLPAAPIPPYASAFADFLGKLKIDYQTILPVQGRASSKDELLKEVAKLKTAS